LTGAANKRSYFATLEYELNKMARYKRPLTIIFIDIDNFKYINDTKGHDAGDLLIKRAVNELKRSVRATDTVARMGGDEFSILLPETDKAGALSIVEKINNTLSGVCLEYNNQISFSIGVAVFNNIPESPDAAIAFADRLMYDVKRDGKNKIKLYEYL
jgi:diguanylate cyclase (GGDEF)-like protein